MNCIKCTGIIPEGRLKALPKTKVCVKCSTTNAWYVRPVITGKTTYSEIEVIKDENAAEEMKRYDRARRSGFGSALYRVKR